MRAIILTACLALIAGCTDIRTTQPAPTTLEAGPVTAKPAAAKPYADPARYEKTIGRFEAADLQSLPPAGAIVCIGSSSMRGWRKTIAEDLAPLTVIPRGFGGSTMNDALHFADRVVLKYKPRAVVLYEGDNDVAGGIAPKKIAETFKAFAAKVHSELPACRIYALSIKPSISRWSMWPTMEAANSLLAAACDADTRLTYVDVASPMLGADGTPRSEIFKPDNLHMSRPGYELWRDTLRPVLLTAELAFEKDE